MFGILCFAIDFPEAVNSKIRSFGMWHRTVWYRDNGKSNEPFFPYFEMANILSTQENINLHIHRYRIFACVLISLKVTWIVFQDWVRTAQ